jgi:hypothetical protein
MIGNHADETPDQSSSNSRREPATRRQIPPRRRDATPRQIRSATPYHPRQIPPRRQTCRAAAAGFEPWPQLSHSRRPGTGRATAGDGANPWTNPPSRHPHIANRVWQQPGWAGQPIRTAARGRTAARVRPAGLWPAAVRAAAVRAAGLCTNGRLSGSAAWTQHAGHRVAGGVPGRTGQRDRRTDRRDPRPRRAAPDQADR